MAKEAGSQIFTLAAGDGSFPPHDDSERTLVSHIIPPGFRFAHNRLYGVSKKRSRSAALALRAVAANCK
jgi:hypothetical protein